MSIFKAVKWEWEKMKLEEESGMKVVSLDDVRREPKSLDGKERIIEMEIYDPGWRRGAAARLVRIRSEWMSRILLWKMRMRRKVKGVRGVRGK